MTETPTRPPDDDPTLHVAPADLPTVRREMLEYLRSDTAIWMQAELIRMGTQGLGPWGVPGTALQAKLLVDDEYERWADAELYYVADEMVDVALGAYRTMPDFAPTAEDFPSRAGVMWFGKPLTGRPMNFTEEQAARATFHDSEAAERFIVDHAHAEIVCVAWGPFAGGHLWGGRDQDDGPGACGNWSTGGVWIHFYTLAAAQYYLATDEDRARYRNMGMPRLNSENDVAFQLKPPVELMPPDKTEDDYLLRRGLEHTTADWARMLMATFLMMRQPMVTTDDTPVPRPERRRQQKAGLRPDKAVRLVQVRRPERTPEARDAGMPDGHATRNWQHSWIVRGFWRNQWYPAQGRHHPKWIAPYVKGPADKPLKGAEKVNVWSK